MCTKRGDKDNAIIKKENDCNDNNIEMLCIITLLAMLEPIKPNTQKQSWEKKTTYHKKQDN